MSSIDERVVSMKFDNKQFESGVSETLNTLGALNKGLKMTGATKGLKDVNDAAKKVDLSGLGAGVEAVKVKFSALQVVAATALMNITNSAMNAGKNMVKAFTIDPITDGFREYETQMNAVQTVLANTASKGTTLKDVSAALDELNVYADKTIYNFTEMTRNIGTFTAAGVDLETSTSAIKGIANLAAVSGSNSQQASTAMYQLSQALATGTVKLMDWNSVVNAGMGGQVFQDALKETARVHGVAIDDIISQEGSFRDSLQTGWLSSEILLETLNKFTGDLNEEQLKSMGYTEEQIAGIIKLGQTANDAATKVKTFTQLTDTLKEAVGSGWAQTWKIIFGDFEEAKSLFTSISDVLGGYINKTSEARNSMLSEWKELGGRATLIDALKNAFNGLSQVLGAVSSAFKSIFPDITGQQLNNFTNGLKNLTENFKMSETNINNLKSTFRGLFAIIDIGKTFFVSIANALGIVVGGSGNLASSILSLTGSFGEWLVYIDNVIKQSGILSTVLNGVANVAKFVMNGISSALDLIGSSISKAFSFSGFEVFNGFLEAINKRIESIRDNSVNMATVVGGAFLSIGQAIANSKVGQVLTSIWETVSKIAGAIGKLVNSMVDSISDAFKNANFNGIYDIIGGISLVAIAKTISDFVKSVSGSLDEVKSPLESIKGVLDGVRTSFEAYQTNLKAGILLKIAAAIGILAASLVAISLIDSNKLVSSLSAIGALFAQLISATYVFTQIGDFKMKVVKASAVLIAMSTSLLILSNAMVNIGSLDWNGVAKGMVGITGLVTTLVLATKSLSKMDGKMNVGIANLIAFSVAIKILASAVNDLSGISWEGLAKGLTGVSVLMASVSLFLNNTTFSAKSITTATGIVILSGAIKILASACGDFAMLSWDNIGKGLVSIGTLLTQLALFSNLTGNAKNVISTGVALVAISASMKILASAIMDFGSMSWESIAKGLVTMAGALTTIALAVKIMPSNMITMGVGLIAVATSLNILANALGSMGNMSWESIGKGLVTLGASLGILAIGLSAMSGSLAGSAALLVAAGALAVLTPSLMALGAMTWDGIIRGLTMLAGTIAIFAASALLLTPILPSMLALAGTMTLLGVSILGIGAGLALAGTGLAALATGFGLLAGVTATGATAIVAALGIIITGVIALIPAILEKIAEGIIAFCKVFTDSIPAVTECITTILAAIIDCIVTNTPVILEGVFKIMNDTLDALIKWAPTLITKVVELGLAILKVIADNIPKFVSAGVDIVVGFIKGVADSLPKIIDSAFNLIVTFINGLADAIRKNAGPIGDACYNLVTAIVDGIGTFNKKFLEAGKYAVEGFIKGLISMPGKIIEAGKSLGRAALNAAKEALDINSPSKEFFSIGEFSGMGLVNALQGYASKVYDSGYNLGSTAISSLKKSIATISDVITGDLDNTPVIKPVMDLSNVQNGIGKLYNMTDNIGSYNIDGSINTSESLARAIKNRDINPIDDLDPKSNPKTPNAAGIAERGPAVIQLVLQNGKAIAEYIIDDVDNLMGQKTKISGRRVGIV